MWFQTRVHHVHTPRRTGVDRSRSPQADTIPYRRLVYDHFDSAVKKFCRLKNAAAVCSPSMDRQAATLLVAQDQPGCLRSMT